MSIGACWHALLWLTFALIARYIAGQAIQSGCNANGPRVPCGKYDIKMLDLGVLFSRQSALKCAMVLEGHTAAYCVHSLLSFKLLMCRSQGKPQHVTCTTRSAGGPSAEAADCLSQGCCYEPAPGDIGGTFLELPACFMPNNGASNYAVRGSTLQTGGQCSLWPLKAPCLHAENPMQVCPKDVMVPEICCMAAADGTQQASLDLQGNGTLQSLGSDISPITLSVENIDQNILRVKMGANGRFEVPGSLFQNTGQGDFIRPPVAMHSSDRTLAPVPDV